MERCFECSAQFVNADAAELHWSITGHLLGDPDAVAAWLAHVGNDSVTTAPREPLHRPQLRSAA